MMVAEKARQLRVFAAPAAAPVFEPQQACNKPSMIPCKPATPAIMGAGRRAGAYCLQLPAKPKTVSSRYSERLCFKGVRWRAPLKDSLAYFFFCSHTYTSHIHTSHT